MRAVWLVLVAGRRTDAAFSRYLASHGYDAIAAGALLAANALAAVPAMSAARSRSGSLLRTE